MLFVCVHNAGWSQMAAGYLASLGAGRVEVLSAGSMPADPAGQDLAAVRPIRGEIRRRVEDLLTELA